MIDEPAGYNTPTLSARGSRLAFSASTGDAPDVWTVDLERGAKTRVAVGAGSPLWSSDASSIFHTLWVDGSFQVFASHADGGSPEQVTQGVRSAASSISSDGKEVFLRQLGQGWDIGVVRLDGERGRRELIATEFDEHTPAISPDGRWLAYASNETSRYEVYVTRYPELGSRWPVSTSGGKEPLWSRDGKELFFRGNGKMMSVSVATDPSTIELGSAEVSFRRPVSARHHRARLRRQLRRQVRDDQRRRLRWHRPSGGRSQLVPGARTSRPRRQVTIGLELIQSAATTSISIRASLGKRAGWTAARAGGVPSVK